MSTLVFLVIHYTASPFMAQKNILASTLTFLESISGNLNILLISERGYAQIDNFSSNCHLQVHMNSRLRQGTAGLSQQGHQDERHFSSV